MSGKSQLLSYTQTSSYILLITNYYDVMNKSDYELAM